MKKMNNLNLERLLKMHEQPELFSDEEIQNALDSDDVSADINNLSAIKRALATEQTAIGDDEINRQWQAFEIKHFGKGKRNGKSVERSWLKVAALFVGVVLIAGVAFAAIGIITNRHQGISTQIETVLEATEKTMGLPSNKAVLSDTLITMPIDSSGIVQFDDVELHDILSAMAAHYHLKLQYESEQTKHVKLFFKWNKRADKASIVELLNSYNRISMELSGETLIIK